MKQIINEEASEPDIDTALHPCFEQGTEEKLHWQPNSFPPSFLCVSFLVTDSSGHVHGISVLCFLHEVYF